MSEDESQPLLRDHYDGPTVIIPKRKGFAQQLKDPRCLAHRLVVLTFMCFLSFGTACKFPLDTVL